MKINKISKILYGVIHGRKLSCKAVGEINVASAPNPVSKPVTRSYTEHSHIPQTKLDGVQYRVVRSRLSWQVRGSKLQAEIFHMVGGVLGTTYGNALFLVTVPVNVSKVAELPDRVEESCKRASIHSLSSST